MLRSALISVLSACLAVCTTLLFQHFWFNPPDTAVHQHVPATPADTDARQQQDSSDIVAPAANAIDLAQALGLGRVLLSRGEPEEAALVYRVAAATAVGAHTADAGTNRDGGEAQHGLGLALLAIGRPGEALEACMEAERLDSSSAAASLCVGVLLVEAGDTTGAVDAFRRALEKAVVAREGSETVGAIRGRLGGVLLDAGEVDEAIMVMADGKSSNNGNIAYHLGVAWQTKGETDKAILSYGRAVELEPKLAAPRINLGAQLVQSGRLLEAEAVLKSAMELAHGDPPSLAAAHANLGAMLRRSGKTQEALESYIKAVESGAGRSALMHIAMLHQDLGQLEQALEASRRAMLEDGDPVDTSPQLQAGLILESLGEIEEAVDHFAQVIELDDQNVDAMTHLAACQQSLGRHHEAFTSYVAASILEPGNLVIYGRLRAAVREAEIASGKAPEEPEVQAAVDTSDTGVLPEKVAEPSEKTMSVGIESDGPVASEVPGGEILEERRPAWEEEPEQFHAAEGGNEPRGQDSQADAAAAAAAAAAEVAAADRAGIRLPDAETGAVGLGSSNIRGDPDALGVSAAKVVPGGGAGASVRQDSAEMRRQSESLSKDEEGATTTRGFFGKKVPEGSAVDPASGAGISAPTTPAVLNSNGEDGGDGVKDNGAANTGKEGPSPHGAIEGALVVASDDNNIAGADARREEGLGLPSGIGTPLPGVNGMAESASVVNLRAAGGDASDEIETPSSLLSGKVKEESAAEAKMKKDPDNGGLGTGGQEEKRPLNISHVPMSDASPSTEEQASAHPADDTAGDNDVGADSSAVVEEIEEDMGSGGGGGEVVSTAASESVLGEGAGIPAGLDKDSPVAPVDDAATLSRDSAGILSGAAVDDAVVHKLEEGALEQGERTHEELVEAAARDPSTAGVGVDSDILTADAAEAWTESVPGEESDPSSSTEAVTPDSERSPFREGGVDNPTTAANQGTVEEAKFGREAAAEDSGAATSTDASVEDVAATQGQEGEVGGGEEGAVGGGTMGAGNDAAAENAPGTAEAATTGAAGVETDEEATTGNSNSSGGDASATGGPATGPESGEAVTTDKADAEVAAAAADVPGVPVVVSDDDTKRARAKAKLGLAKLNQGQTKKAAALFEKAASIDPGWWGGFYYAALAHDTLGNPEAAAGALISALGVPPVEEGEVAELAALSSKVLAALGGGNGPVAAALKTAMDASGLSFTVAPPAPKPSSPSSPDRTDTSAPQGGGGGAGSSVGRTPGMESSAGGGSASGGGAASRTGLEADLADQFGAGAAPGGIDGAGAEFGNTNNGGGGSGGGVAGTNRGTVPGREQRREASPPPWGDPNGQKQDLGGVRGAGAGDSRFRDRESAVARGEDRYSPSKPDAARRRSWSRDGLGGKVRGGDAGREPGGAAAGRGSDGRPSFKIDSTASAEDILASMGLKGGVGLGPAGGGGGARTPEDMMAAGSSSGGDEGGSGKKKGLFGGLWNRKAKG